MQNCQNVDFKKDFPHFFLYVSMLILERTDVYSGGVHLLFLCDLPRDYVYSGPHVRLVNYGCKCPVTFGSLVQKLHILNYVTSLITLVVVGEKNIGIVVSMLLGLS